MNEVLLACVAGIVLGFLFKADMKTMINKGC